MVISVVNRKGGTGKTTTVVNLARSLTLMGKDVLVLDMDPQANLSYSFGVDTQGCHLGEVLLETEVDIDSIFCSKGVDIIPSNEDLQEYEWEMIRSDYSEFCLRDALATVVDGYDIVLIDCPPAASFLTKVSLLASDQIIVPMLFDHLSLMGVRQMEALVDRMNVEYGSNIKIAGALGVMVDTRRKKLSSIIVDELIKTTGISLFKSYIRLNVRAAEAPHTGVSVVDYDTQSASSKDYRKFAKEVAKTLL